jgi:hypothetical protein
MRKKEKSTRSQTSWLHHWLHRWLRKQYNELYRKLRNYRSPWTVGGHRRKNRRVAAMALPGRRVATLPHC